MAYNFNPRERQKRTMKFDDYQRLGMIKWNMVPIGQIDINKKYLTPCGPAYRNYNECLRETLFNKQVCKPKFDEMAVCQKNNDLFQTESKLQILKSFKKRKIKKVDEQSTRQNDGDL